MVDRPDWTNASFQASQQIINAGIYAAEDVKIVTPFTNNFGRPMVIERVTCFARPDQYYELRGLCWVIVRSSSMTQWVGCTLSPEMPFATVPVSGGSMVIQPGDDLVLYGQTQEGAGSAHVYVTIEYYLGG